MKNKLRYGEKDVLVRFVNLANILICRSGFLSSLYLTKTGILRIADGENRKAIRHLDNKIICNHQAVEWAMDALTVINNKYPHSSIKETKELQKLACKLLKEKRVFD